MSKFIDLTGQKFGWWKVLRWSGSSTPGHTMWFCVCKCGTKRAVYHAYLRNGGSQSCGCKIKTQGAPWNKTHGQSSSNIYKLWLAMKRRCNPNNKQSKAKKNYSDRGIKICKRWWKFENFFADMGPNPPDMTLERINNDKGYSPSNCKWATYKEQAANRRTQTNARLITCFGITYEARKWARVVGFTHSTILRRLNRGLHPVQILFTKPWQG